MSKDFDWWEDNDVDNVCEEEPIEYQMIHRFFEEEHLITRRFAEQERIKILKPPTWHSGGRVPRGGLYRPDNIKLLQIDLIPAVDIIYVALERVKKLAKTKYDENVGIRLIPKIIRACGERGIPHNFVPGMMLLYLEHCEGCQWRSTVPRLLEEKLASLRSIERLREKAQLLHSQGKISEAKDYEAAAKLSPDDWPEYMTSAVAAFLKETRQYR